MLQLAVAGKSNVIIRPYRLQDHSRVVEICKNVYNGTDYMPRLVNHFAEQPDTLILVSQPAAAEHEEGGDIQDIQGLVCGHKRGSAFFLMGLRVHEDARGQGLARTLMEHICNASCAFGKVQAITSATIPQNTASIRILNALGFTHTHTIDMWPSYTALHNYEHDMGCVPGSTEQRQQQQQTRLLDYIPGARSYVSAASSSLGVELQDWVQCSSLQELQQAVASIRQQQAQLPELQQLPPGTPLDWLPWVYESQPLDSPWVQDRLAAGDVWLLPPTSGHASLSSSVGGDTSSSSLASNLSSSSNSSSSSSLTSRESLPSSSGCRAVVVTGWSTELRRLGAGVLTAGDAFVPAAVEFLDSRAPHFMAFCDRGTRHSSGKVDPDLVLPELFALTGTEMEPGRSVVMYAKPLTGAAGECLN